MKDNTKKKAPKVIAPSKKKPLSSFKEKGSLSKGKGPQFPMTGKKLAK